MTTFSAPRTRTSTASVGEPIIADTAQLRKLASALGKCAPAARKELNRSLRLAAKIVADDAKGRASWSTRIPKTIKVQGGAGKLRVVAGGPNAPQAVGYEVGTKGNNGRFRHPVFSAKFGGRGTSGPRNKRALRGGPVYASVATRPYLLPAWEAHKDEVFTLVADAIDEATNALLKEV